MEHKLWYEKPGWRSGITEHEKMRRARSRQTPAPFKILMRQIGAYSDFPGTLVSFNAQMAQRRTPDLSLEWLQLYLVLGRFAPEMFRS